MSKKTNSKRTVERTAKKRPARPSKTAKRKPTTKVAKPKKRTARPTTAAQRIAKQPRHDDAIADALQAGADAAGQAVRDGYIGSAVVVGLEVGEEPEHGIEVELAPLPDGSHDRIDCPCDHPPGVVGPCGGCNCADVVPAAVVPAAPIGDLIASSSIGAGLANIGANGIDAELADLEAELGDPAADAVIAAIAHTPPREPPADRQPPRSWPPNTGTPEVPWQPFVARIGPEERDPDAVVVARYTVPEDKAREHAEQTGVPLPAATGGET
jgi:hypothetical protein